MTETGELFLGIIAFAVMIMALIQVMPSLPGSASQARRPNRHAARSGNQAADRQPDGAFERSGARRGTAAKQAERLDRVFGELVQRVDETLAAAQEFVTGPARQGMAIMAGVKAVIDSFRGMREASRRRAAAGPSSTRKNRFSSADPPSPLATAQVC